MTAMNNQNNLAPPTFTVGGERGGESECSNVSSAGVPPVKSRTKSTLSLRFRKFSSTIRKSSAASPPSSPLNTSDSGTGRRDDNEPPQFEVPRKFLRQDSVLIRVQAGEPFTPHSDLLVEQSSKSDQRLGTLGELRHLLQTSTSTSVKKFLRHNFWILSHRIRSEVWKELCKRDGALDANIIVYRETAAQMSGDALGDFGANCLSFALSTNERRLNEKGKGALLRVIGAVHHIRPDFTFVPILYPLAAAMLHFQSEEETFACLLRVLERGKDFCFQSEMAMRASQRTLVVLVKRHLGRCYNLLKKSTPEEKDENLVKIFENWSGWILEKLPFYYSVRALDCFLFEGQKVLFRMALGILSLWSKERQSFLKNKSNLSCAEVAEDIATFCQTIPCSCEKLFKVAFGIRNLSLSKILRLQLRHEMLLEHNRPRLSYSFYDPDRSQQSSRRQHQSSRLFPFKMDSRIIDNSQAQLVNSWLPARFQLLSPVRLFSVLDEGTSFTRFWQKIEEAEPTIILIQTSKDEIMGAFCSTFWGKRRQLKTKTYFGTGESFLFRLDGKSPRKWDWVGNPLQEDFKPSVQHSEELFQFADLSVLVLGGGGGEGLCVREELVSGSTGRCETFANPPLVDDGEFDIRDLEVFSLVAEEE